MPLIAIIIGVVIAALDQLFKFLVTAHLKPVGTVNVLGDVFKLTYVENRGVAFGMFQGMQWIFVVLNQQSTLGHITRGCLSVTYCL